MKWFRIFLIIFFIFYGIDTVFSYQDEQDTIVITERDDILYIKGHIGPNITNYILSQNPKKIKRIILNSYGGKLYQALKIAKFIRNNNIDTYVGKNSICYSACTVIFQAGKNRIAHKTAKFLYHYAYNKSKENIIKPNINASIIFFNYLMLYGASPDLIARIQIGSELILTAQETVKYFVVTVLEND